MKNLHVNHQWLFPNYQYSRHSLFRHRVSRRICKVLNSVPIHSIYNFAYKLTFRLSQHVFRSQTMFSRLNLIVCFDNHCIHNASCKNRDPCVFAGQIWHQLIYPEAVSIGHSVCKAYVIGEHMSLKVDWATRVCRIFNTYVYMYLTSNSHRRSFV